MTPRTRSLVPLFLVGMALALATGCTPRDLAGPPLLPGGDDTDDKDTYGDAGGDDDPEPPPAPQFTFTISGSPTDPYLHQGLAAHGSYDLYLWLACSSVGLSQLQADFTTQGDALIGDHFFSPADGVVSIVWQDFGQLNLALSECVEGPMLLGTLHLDGSGTGVRIGMQQPADTTLGAISCGADAAAGGFTCTGYQTFGSLPPQSGALADGCQTSAYWSSFEFAISASRSSAYLSSVPSEPGPLQLYVWCVAGAFSAVQGELHIVGGAPGFDPVFAAEPPYISLNVADGPDVLLASPGCSSGVKLLGSFWVTDDGTGVWVTMTPGLDGGAADCSTNPQASLFRCRPFSNRG